MIDHKYLYVSPFFYSFLSTTNCFDRAFLPIWLKSIHDKTAYTCHVYTLREI